MRLMTTPGVAASSAHMSRPFGIELSCSSLKFCCTLRRRRVDDRRLAGDRHGLLQRRDAHLDVDIGGEPERDLDAFALDAGEARRARR